MQCFFCRCFLAAAMVNTVLSTYKFMAVMKAIHIGKEKGRMQQVILVLLCVSEESLTPWCVITI